MLTFSPPIRAVSAMFFLNGTLFGAWAARVPTVKATFGLSADDLGLLLLLLAGGAIVSFSLAGEASNRYGAASITRWIAWIYAAAMVAIALAPNLWLLSLALFIFGMCHGGMDVAMNGWAAEVERAHGRPIMASFHAIFSVGAGVGAMGGALALKLDFSLMMHFLLYAALVTFPCMMLASISWQSDIIKSSQRSAVFALPKGALVFVGIVAFSSSLGEGAMADWSAVFLIETIAVHESAAAIGYAVFSVAMVATRFAGNSLINRFGPVMITRLSGCFACSGVLIAVMGANLSVVLCGYALMGIGLALIFPMAFSRAANDPHQASGTALAGVATLGYGGMLLGPPIIGFIAEYTSFEVSFLLLAGLATLMIILAKTMAPPPSKQ